MTDRAFEELFHDEFSPLVREVGLIVGSSEEAKDVVADAFVKLLVRWDRVQHYDRPGAWVRRVAIRDAVRARRRLWRTVERDFETTPTDSSAARDLNIDLHRVLMRLPSKQRAAVVLRYYGGHPYADIAD